MTPNPRVAGASRRGHGHWPLHVLALVQLLALSCALVIFAFMLPILSVRGPIPLSAGYPVFFGIGLLVAWHARPQSGIAIDDRSTVQRIKLAAVSVGLFVAGVYAGLDFLAEVDADLRGTLYRLESFHESADPPAE